MPYVRLFPDDFQIWGSPISTQQCFILYKHWKHRMWGKNSILFILFLHCKYRSMNSPLSHNQSSSYTSDVPHGVIDNFKSEKNNAHISRFESVPWFIMRSTIIDCNESINPNTIRKESFALLSLMRRGRCLFGEGSMVKVG